MKYQRFVSLTAMLTFLLLFISSGVLYFITLFAYQFYKGTPIMRIFVAIVLMTYTIISIQQNLGRIEMHFHIFIALAFLTIYKDFIPVALAVIHDFCYQGRKTKPTFLLSVPALAKNFKKNSTDRCYYCKKELFGRLTKIAKKNSFKLSFKGRK
jgi:hypothetical protein